MTGSENNSAGFTLIELITTIVLVGVIAGVLAPVISMAIRSFSDTEARTDLTAKGRLSLERIARELRHAIPNSISVINDGTTEEGIEFITSRAGGRYVDISDDFGSAFNVPARRFQKNKNKTHLYLIAPGLNFQAYDQLVIVNTSTANLIAGQTIIPITAISNTSAAPDGTTDGKIVSFATHLFPNESPGRHAQIADFSHEIGKLGNGLRWHRNTGSTDYNLAQNWSVSDPMLIDGVDSINFTYIEGSPQSNGILRIELKLSKGKESIELYHEVQIRNTP
jgi:MSHA biogenesis protein MshO